MAKPITVSIVGNAGPLIKAIGEAEGGLGKLGGVAKLAAAGIAAGFAGAAAGIAVATKAAIEDEKSFRLLEQALKANTSATEAQIKATDEQIGRLSLATGVADDQLRPALASLVRATGDVTFSQDLLNTALDISAATGKDLESVSVALAKAQAGNVTALQKLGIPLDDNIKKSKDFDAALVELNKTFGGAAATAADTFEGRMRRARVALSETVETIGYAFLPIAQRLLEAFTNLLNPALAYFSERVMPVVTDVLGRVGDVISKYVVPFVQDHLVPAFFAIVRVVRDYVVPAVSTVLIPIINGLRNVFETVRSKIEENRDSFSKLGTFFSGLAKFVRDTLAPVFGIVLVGAFRVLGPVIGTVIDVAANIIDAFAAVGRFVLKIVETVARGVTGFVNGVISGINAMIRAINAIPGVNIDEIGKISFTLPSLPSLPSAPSLPTPAAPTAPGETLPTLPIPEIGGGDGGGAGGGGGGGGGGRRGGGGDDRFSTMPFPQPIPPDLPPGVIGRPEDLLRRGTVNITVNTVTADAELPNLIVEALQQYNLTSGPLDVEIAV